MLSLRMGANAPLNTSRFEVIIAWPNAAGTLDCSAYLLGAEGKVCGDDDMIFYNQRAHPTGAIEITRIEDGLTHLAVDLGAAPAEIQRIAICVTVEEPGRTMAAFAGTSAMLRSNGEAQLQFAPELGSATEVALRLVEFYRRNHTWKIRADGQGFNDGLAPLARSFGIDVAEDEAPPPHELCSQPLVETSPNIEPTVGSVLAWLPQASAPSKASEASPASTTPALRPRDNDVVRLEPGIDPPHWKTDADNHLGAISAKLGWSSQCGGVEGRPRPLVLSLGCLYELRDGSRGAVQSWDSNGNFDLPPFMQLSAAEIEGLTGSQKLRINGEQWSLMERMALFAFIPRGAPSWQTSTLSLEIAATSRKPVLLELDGGLEGCGLAALVLLKNEGGNVSFNRLAEFLPGHHELDRELDWGLSWSIRDEHFQ